MQEYREQDFVATFNNLFDIAHADALQLVTIEEDKLFHLSQRQEGRPGSMIGSDRVLLEKEKRKLLREAVGKHKSAEYIANIHGEYKNPECTLTEDESSENEQDDEDLSKDFDDLPGPSNVKKSRARINFITPELVTVLDKCKVSDRDAVRILIAVKL
ncbi:uncharacterized protein [Eurosta solidaginis]|uniref:uncharacterized protein n=1 Tax=Eurosta solidaginis TaxID=178769 RepID=UPI003530E6C6